MEDYMQITLTLGWWLLPLMLTIASFAWAIPLREDERNQSYIGDALMLTLRLGFAAIVSLGCWLIWALGA
jgi:hypothetical protein